MRLLQCCPSNILLPSSGCVYLAHTLFCQLLKQANEAKQGLSEAISRWEGATGAALQAPKGLLEAAQDDSHPMRYLEQQVVHLQREVKQHSTALKNAGRCAVTTHPDLCLSLIMVTLALLHILQQDILLL